MNRGALAAIALAAIAATGADAQLAPNADWRTIRTEHFLVHFTPPLEAAARRTAADAEVAYAQLARELVPPRGMIDVVISDDVDITNGYATQFPTNRIVMYAAPPVVETALRFTDDPDALVITHELTHIFHLDRSRGIWDLGQHVFGRAPFLFPNVYSPSWLLEGLAVYYETRLTGTGRVTGSENRMIARAEALERRFPSVDEISLATARFPYGESVYVYGSLFLDYLARTRGDSSIPHYVESASESLIPVWLDRPARQAFGIGFARAWREWGDSVTRTAGDAALPVPGWRYLTEAGGVASFSRWVDDTAITYSGSTGRESPGAFRVGLDGGVARTDRRNSDSPTLNLADGGRLFSQLEYTDAYHIRSDLFVQRGRRSYRLTDGARLSVPDLRADGRIVAVETVPAGTRLVLLWSDGSAQRPLTTGGPDDFWSEPRWSPDGRHVAASHWIRGGTSEIAVVDTTGAIVQRIAAAHAIQSAPSWNHDGTRILFTSDRTGVANIYSAAFAPGGTEDLRRLTTVGTGIFYPQLSPDGRWLAGTVVLGDGYHVGIVPVDRLTSPAAEPLPPSAFAHPESAAVSVDAPSARYSPWRSLWPRYWMPEVEPSIAGGTRLGAYTSGSDVVGRHSYDAQVYVPTDHTGVIGDFDYAYAGLGMPILTASAYQQWDNAGTVRDDHGNAAGTVRRRTVDESVGLTLVRPRYRTYASFSLSAGLESQTYATDPASVIARIDSSFRARYDYPQLLASVTWSNVQRPLLSVSPEDGVTAAATARERFTSGNASDATFTAVSVASAYKSLDLPGFSHHVLAVRASAGFSDDKAIDYLEVGGVSGSLLSVVPGVVIGQGAQTFPVRGFQNSTLVGIRAYSASAEYRVPLTLLDDGWGILPFFADRASLSLFYDLGDAWCPSVLPPGSLCTSSALTQHNPIASTGMELNLNAAVLQWDTPYRFRAGIAVPARGRKFFGSNSAAGYFSIGLSF
jgi:hypothetical protein